MPGSPKRRARAEAQMLRMGLEPTPRRDPLPDPSSTATAPRTARTATANAPAPIDAPGDLIELLVSTSAGSLDPETSAQFTQLREKAFAFAHNVMSIPLDQNSKHFAKVLSVQQAIAVAMLTATVRVRPGDLRDKDDDGVAELLRQIRAVDDTEFFDRPLTAEEMLN